MFRLFGCAMFRLSCQKLIVHHFFSALAAALMSSWRCLLSGLFSSRTRPRNFNSAEKFLPVSSLLFANFLGLICAELMPLRLKKDRACLTLAGEAATALVPF